MNYNKEELAAIEAVLDMGLYIENSNGDVIKFSGMGEYEINFHNGDQKEFENINKALKYFKL